MQQATSAPVQVPVPTALQDLAAQMTAVRERLTSATAQMHSLEDQRSVIERQLIQASAGKRQGLDLRLEELVGAVGGQRQKVSELQQQLENLQVQALTSSPGIIMVPPQERILGYTKNEFTGIASVVLLFPLVLAVAVRIMRAGAHRTVVNAPSVPALDQDRLARLEQAMDAVAVEIERIGEGQRFQTRLMSERRSEPQRVNTPH